MKEKAQIKQRKKPMGNRHNKGGRECYDCYAWRN